MTKQETLDYIHNVKWQGSKPGLSRTRELLAALGNPEKSLKFVHVAGTNGKGSTCAVIDSVLQCAGYKTGLYTSPFIFEFNERIRVNGRNISDSELSCAVAAIKPHADAMRDPPTEFELITALAMQYFSGRKCDIVVLETGMGGELDSTNVIDTPELAVITAIDYDHVEHLGPDITDIARAKAGIIKAGGDVLIYGGGGDVEDVFEKTAARQKSRLHKADFSRIKKADAAPGGTKLTIEPYSEMLLPLAGIYQPYNALVAVTALELLRDKGYNIDERCIAEGLAAVKWPARFEFLGHDPAFILDGAHNRHGAKAAADSLRSYFSGCEIIIVMGVLADKDAEGMAQELAAVASLVFTVTPHNPRSMKADELAAVFKRHGIRAAACAAIDEGVKQALGAARESRTKAVVCALGSLYMSADIKHAYQETFN